MFDLVPLACPRWKVTHRNGQPRSIGQPLEFPLPETDARAVAAAGIRRNHQRWRSGIGAAAHVLPPAANRIDGEARGVVSNPDTDPAFIAPEIVHTVGNRFAMAGITNEKVVHADAVRFPRATPGA